MPDHTCVIHGRRRTRRRGRAPAQGCQGIREAYLTAWLGDETARNARQLFAKNEIGSFAIPAAAIDGFMQLVRYARAQEELMRTPPAHPAELKADSEKAPDILRGALKSGRTRLSDVETNGLLAAYGIPTVPTMHIASPEEVRGPAESFIREHGACVVKILSEDIPHKSDVGGVRLGLERPEEAM